MSEANPPQDLPLIERTPAMDEWGDHIYNEAVLQKLLGDQSWRLDNLYWIKPEGGGDPIRFKARDHQRLVYQHLITTPQIPAFIIKSRRLGFSTALSVFSSDQVAFKSGQNINLVDLTQPDAFKKMREQIRYAVDSLPRQILDRVHFAARNDSQLTLRIKGQPESANSNLFAGMNARGGDCSGLWTSEWGPLAAQDPYRSGKILSGAFPAARLGWRCTETTWMGGKNGDLWELIKPIYEGNPNADGKIFFFPWHGDPVCVSLGGEITDDVIDYFAELEDQLGKKFSDEQKKWWAIEKTRLRHKMAQEFPSTLEEALSAPGNAPKFSERGLNFIEKHLHDHRTQYGLLNVKNDRAIWEQLPDNDDSAWLRIWEHPQPGCSYLIPGDYCTAEDAANPDYHATGVLRAAYFDPQGIFVPAAVVAAIKTDRRTDLDVLAAQQRAMQLYYGTCMIVPETNNLAGYVNLLRNAGCENIYQRTLHPDSADADKRTRKETGWKTTVQTKPLICDKLTTAIREEELLVYCPRILSELRAFQIDNQALAGHHDDWVIFLAIGNHVLPQATPFNPRAPTVHRAPSDHHPDHYSTDNTQHFYPTEDQDSILG